MNSSNAYTRYSLKAAYLLSLIIGLLMAGVSLAGLLFQSSIYPTYELRDAFFANDVVNLFIGLLILIISMWLTRSGNLAGLLLWPGALLFALYNYVAYLIGMPFGWISFVYLTLVMLSACAIFYLLRTIDKKSVQQQLAGTVPEKLSGWVLVVLGSFFVLRVLGILVQAGMDHITLPMSETGVLIADLILSTIWIAGGVLLLLRQPMGYVSGLGLLFSGSMLFIALIVFLLLRPVLTDVSFALADVVVVLSMGMICFIPFYLFLRGVQIKGKS
jgi:hypothetical protein